MGKRTIVSILHHSIPNPQPNRVAEEENIGWHFRTAKALKDRGGYATTCVRPSGHKEWVNRIIEDVPVTLAPTFKLSVSDKLWKWSEVSLHMVDYAGRLVARNGYIPYIHEYRALNSELIIRRLTEYPMILQHHGSAPLTHSNLLSANPLSVIKEASKAKRERLLRRVHGAIFVLNDSEKQYLENLGVGASAKIRTMAVEFNKLKPVAEGDKRELRNMLGIPEDATLLCSYVGVFRENFSTIKGAHLIAKIQRGLNSKTRKSPVVIVTGLSTCWVRKLRNLGVKAYDFLPHGQYLNIVKASDAYIVPATSGYHNGGAGSVAIMEALALGKPVVSPTLIHFPEKDKVKCIGIVTPFADNENALRVFIERLAFLVENLSLFRAEDIRDIAHKYYSWESFVKVFEETLRGM